MFPFFLSIGMSADQFWHGDPELAAAYRRAAELRNQRLSEEMWLQGVYIYRAISVSLHNAFSKKGTRPAKYPEEPIRVIPYTEEELKRKAEIERQRVIKYFDDMAKKFNKKG